MQCVITSIDKTQTLVHLKTITVPTKTGIVQIKKGHAEYFVEITRGEVVCIASTGKKTITPVKNAICHVQEDNVTILT